MSPQEDPGFAKNLGKWRETMIEEQAIYLSRYR
jgi:hypothetical protein